jgi:hypothetical protein
VVAGGRRRPAALHVASGLAMASTTPEHGGNR